MIYQYVVTLKNTNNRAIDLTGLILSLFSLCCFTYELIRSQYAYVAYLLGIVFVAGFVAWNLYQSAKKRKVFYSRALLIAGLVWMKMPYFQWLAFVYIILALLEYQAKYSVEIGFSDNHILINSLFKRRYKWSQFNHIILKDGLLTLDFVSNRLLQREILDEEDSEADEDEFNDYCRRQLRSV